MRPGGTGKRRLVTGLAAEMPTWAPNGRTIMFTGTRLSGNDRSSLYMIRRNGSGLHRLPIKGWLPDWVAEPGS